MTQVIVYKNLKRGDWSVAQLKGQRGRGKVVAHASSLTLTDVTFFVSEAQRQWVIAKGERSVHAYAIGTIADAPADITDAAVRVSYNPYRSGAFTTDAGAAIAHADRVAFTLNGKAWLV